MAYLGSQTNAEFGNGLNHMQNPARANAGSITLNDSPEQSAAGPHSVPATTVGGSQDDDSYEQFQREQGGYAPGSMTQFQDRLDQGSNDNTA